MEGLLSIFAEIRDKRRENARHSLSSVLFVTVSSMLCGGKIAVDFADFAESHFDVVSEIVDLPHGPPTHDTFSRILRILDPGELTGALERAEAAFAKAGDGLPVFESTDRKHGRSETRRASVLDAALSPTRTGPIWPA